MDRFNPKFPDCFRCRASSIGVAFAGGKDYFHSQTIKEGQERTLREGRANGYDPVPAWTKTNYGAASISHEAKLAKAITPKTESTVTV